MNENDKTTSYRYDGAVGSVENENILMIEDFCTNCNQMTTECESCGQCICDYDDPVFCQECDEVGCGSCGSETRQSCSCDYLYESHRDENL